MIEIIGIDHVVLRTTRLREMLTFYCDVLGCRIERETPASEGLTQLRAGRSLIDLVTVDSKLGRSGGAAPTGDGINMDHLCLQIKPMAERTLRAYLESSGIECGDFADRYGAGGLGRSLYIADPEGNTVELRPDPQ